MAWKKTDFLVKKRLNQHGLGILVEAGQICRYSESLYPDLFRAISVRNNCLHIETSKAKQLQFTMIKGKLLQEINSFATEKSLPPITRLRLTISNE